MIKHTLILSTPKIALPSTKIIDFVKDLIGSNLTNIEYFGNELKNQNDYFNDEMKNKMDTSTFIIIHFEDQEIIYKTHYENSVFNIIYKKLNFGKIGQVITTDKDISIYIQ